MHASGDAEGSGCNLVHCSPNLGACEINTCVNEHAISIIFLMVN